MKMQPDPAHELHPYEINALIDWLLYRIDQPSRHQLAREFPEIYYRITGARICPCAAHTPEAHDRKVPDAR